MVSPKGIAHRSRASRPVTLILNKGILVLALSCFLWSTKAFTFPSSLRFVRVVVASKNARHGHQEARCPLQAQTGDDGDGNDSSSLQEYLRKAQDQAKQDFLTNEAPAWISAQEELPFSCTECGRCCKTSGSVYLSPEETTAAATVLDLTTETFIDQFASHTLAADDDMQPWVRLKEQEIDGSKACVFLDEATNHCRIYKARPVQCRTYPFWPQVVGSESSWDNEARRADNDTESPLSPWSPDSGGCEGLRPLSAATFEEGVSRKDALQQLYEYKQAERRFPHVAKEIAVQSNEESDSSS